MPRATLFAKAAQRHKCDGSNTVANYPGKKCVAKEIEIDLGEMILLLILVVLIGIAASQTFDLGILRADDCTKMPSTEKTPRSKV